MDAKVPTVPVGLGELAAAIGLVEDDNVLGALWLRYAKMERYLAESEREPIEEKIDTTIRRHEKGKIARNPRYQLRSTYRHPTIVIFDRLARDQPPSVVVMISRVAVPLAVVEGIQINVRLELAQASLLLGLAVKADAERHAVHRVGLDADGRDLPEGRALPIVVLADNAGVGVGLVAVDGLVAADEAGVATPRLRHGDGGAAMMVDPHGVRAGSVALLVAVGDHVAASRDEAGGIGKAKAGHVDLHLDVGFRSQELENDVLGGLDAPRGVEGDGGLEVVPHVVVRGRLLGLPVHGDVVVAVGGVSDLGLDLEALLTRLAARGGSVGTGDPVLGQHDLGGEEVVDARHQAALEPGDVVGGALG